MVQMHVPKYCESGGQLANLGWGWHSLSAGLWLSPFVADLGVIALGVLHGLLGMLLGSSC